MVKCACMHGHEGSSLEVGPGVETGQPIHRKYLEMGVIATLRAISPRHPIQIDNDSSSSEDPCLSVDFESSGNVHVLLTSIIILVALIVSVFKIGWLSCLLFPVN